jgi:hypothetical protein
MPRTTQTKAPKDVASPFWRQALSRLGGTSIGDGMLGGTGCMAALVCAGFAAYMTLHPQPTFNGIEHLMIFAQPNYQGGPSFAADTTADHKGIDYSATGTIRSDAAPRPKKADFAEPIVTSYTLHYVHDGDALIVGKDDSVYRVSIGTFVPGVGRVIAIEVRQANGSCSPRAA